MICESDFPRGARQAARVILIDPGDRVLFCRGVEPATGAVFWVMPGGGLEDGESYEDAARREVLEETGLAVEIGPCVWHRRHQHVWDGKDADQFERFYVARVPHSAGTTGARADRYVTGMRWWTLAEMAATEETLVPGRAAALLADVLAGRSGEVIDCGV